MRKIPSIEKFRDVAQTQNGHKTNIAYKFGVSRSTLDKWIKDNPEFNDIINDSRMRKVDDCIDRAYQLAVGIPEIEDKKIVGWKERPDGNMLRYLLSTLGRNEGFGENIDITTNGKDVVSPPSVNIQVVTNDAKLLELQEKSVTLKENKESDKAD